MIRLKAFAKVNYGLSVKGVRDDGYHEVATVMQSVSLADEVGLQRADEGFGLAIEPEETDVGPLEKNTVYRAWLLLCKEAGRELPARVRLSKKIPSGAGLGGASADAAAVLVGANELFGLGLSGEKLRGLGVRVGADVPFCISGGTALGEGIGEVLTPLPAPPAHALLVAKPQGGAETARIYNAHDETPKETPKETPESTTSTGPILKALEAGNLEGLSASLGNDLAHTTKNFVPEVAAYEAELLEAGALGACMSGTGTAVYGVFQTEEKARAASRRLTVPFAGVYEPVARGTEIVEG